jgi:hypothetical protein
VGSDVRYEEVGGRTVVMWLWLFWDMVFRCQLVDTTIGRAQVLWMNAGSMDV